MSGSAQDSGASPRAAADAAIGAALVLTAVLQAAFEWRGDPMFGAGAHLLALIVTPMLALRAAGDRQVFAAIAAALILIAVVSRPDWLSIVDAGLRSAAFIAAFFTAQAVLRSVSARSASIQRCGRFLAAQPPGRRYGALTFGGVGFGLLLNYGTIVLLGGLAADAAARETNAELRAHRRRRMLLAVQRGFVSTLPWSPVAFAVAITTALTPGAVWADAVGACLVSGVLALGVGWAFDAIFKPRLSAPAPPRAPLEDGWWALWPLLALLGVLAALVAGVHIASGVRVVGVVMVVVPALSLIWLVAQARGSAQVVLRWGADFVADDLPAYRGELLLLMMAGFIGVVGARLLAPWLAASGLNLAALGPTALLLGLVWFIPATGQIGMNPILTASLILPLLPEASALGLRPVDLVVAVTAGWALSGMSSPFTATTVLLGALGGVSGTTVGRRWNGAYTLVVGVVLSVWVLIHAGM